MKVMDLTQIRANEAFARKATDHFTAHPSHYTYAEGDPQPGELLAIRWNDFTVLIVKLDESFQPECWPVVQLIGTDLPKRTLT